MNCPKCGSENVKVVDTIPGCHNNIFRRRRCLICSTRFRTVEITIEGDEQLTAEYRETPKCRNAIDKFTRHMKGSNK
jgi:transcriptional regulator NrdR family protein